MKTRLHLAVVVMTALFIGALLFNRRSTPPAPATPVALPVSQPEPVETPTGAATAIPGGPAGSPASAAGTAGATPDVQTEMETVKFFVRDYRAAFGGNPVGNNAEITKALLGANRTQTKFVLPGASAVNATGELVDRWGTPYFFNALSAREMEIYSAGPDKRMWTSDDIVLR